MKVPLTAGIGGGGAIFLPGMYAGGAEGAVFCVDGITEAAGGGAG